MQVKATSLIYSFLFVFIRSFVFDISDFIVICGFRLFVRFFHNFIDYSSFPYTNSSLSPIELSVDIHYNKLSVVFGYSYLELFYHYGFAYFNFSIEFYYLLMYDWELSYIQFLLYLAFHYPNVYSNVKLIVIMVLELMNLPLLESNIIIVICFLCYYYNYDFGEFYSKRIRRTLYIILSNSYFRSIIYSSVYFAYCRLKFVSFSTNGFYNDIRIRMVFTFSVFGVLFHMFICKFNFGVFYNITLLSLCMAYPGHLSVNYLRSMNISELYVCVCLRTIDIDLVTSRFSGLVLFTTSCSLLDSLISANFTMITLVHHTAYYSVYHLRFASSLVYTHGWILDCYKYSTMVCFHCFYYLSSFVTSFINIYVLSLHSLLDHLIELNSFSSSVTDSNSLINLFGKCFRISNYFYKLYLSGVQMSSYLLCFNIPSLLDLRSDLLSLLTFFDSDFLVFVESCIYNPSFCGLICDSRDFYKYKVRCSKLPESHSTVKLDVNTQLTTFNNYKLSCCFYKRFTRHFHRLLDLFSHLDFMDFLVDCYFLLDFLLDL